MKSLIFGRFAAVALFAIARTVAAGAGAGAGATIKVVDDQTNRGVPLVRLTTTNAIEYWTDSGGVVFIDDATLLGRNIFFELFSHGYQYPDDGFGYRGRAIELVAGKTTTLKVHRTNIAERLYRLTGEGIYRDTVAAGLKPPIEQPLLDGGVVGQDTCQCVVYDGKIRWFFGDTSKFDYPLGMFGTSGATSELNDLPAIEGINLSYFVDAKNFSRRMLPKFEKGAGWLDSLCVVPDATGKPRMVAKCDNVPGVAKPFGRYLLAYNDKTDAFETTSKIPEDAPLTPGGNALVAEDDGKSYVYFCRQYPNVRVPATAEAFGDLTRYELFTSAGLAPSKGPVPGTAGAVGGYRDAENKLIWEWTGYGRPTGLNQNVDQAGMKKIVEATNQFKPDKGADAYFLPFDVEHKKPIRVHNSSVAFNEYRRKFVMIAEQAGGESSALGELWYLEAPRPEGPWRNAVKIVSHEKMTFYNPVQMPFMATDGGRYIYFQGTYVTTFSNGAVPTPRYEYNQIVYRLDLADPRLKPAGS